MLSAFEPCAILRVQAWDVRSIVPAAAERLLGAEWPRSTGACASGDADVICVGPADWLVLAAEAERASRLESLRQAFRDTAFRASDVTAALVRLKLEGPLARTLLARACSLDMHPDVFGVGRSARTRCAGMPVVVRCLRSSIFECIVASSYAEYLVSWFNDAAAGI